MEKLYTGLLENMDLQSAIYEKLLALAQEKQPVLVKGNIAELERITRDEEILILQVGRLEEQRKALHQKLANHFTLSPEELTVSELVKRTNNKDSVAQLLVLLEKTEGKLRDLEDVNKSNSQLIKNSLDFIEFSMNVLVNNDKAPGYGETDDEKKRVSAKIFDRKI